MNINENSVFTYKFSEEILDYFYFSKTKGVSFHSDNFPLLHLKDAKGDCLWVDDKGEQRRGVDKKNYSQTNQPEFGLLHKLVIYAFSWHS